jgi:hypothetical protein
MRAQHQRLRRMAGVDYRDYSRYVVVLCSQPRRSRDSQSEWIVRTPRVEVQTYSAIKRLAGRDAVMPFVKYKVNDIPLFRQ